MHTVHRCGLLLLLLHVSLSPCHDREPCKSTQPNQMVWAVGRRGVSRPNYLSDGDAHWRHLANIRLNVPCSLMMWTVATVIYRNKLFFLDEKPSTSRRTAGNVPLYHDVDTAAGKCPAVQMRGPSVSPLHSVSRQRTNTFVPLGRQQGSHTTVAGSPPMLVPRQCHTARSTLRIKLSNVVTSQDPYCSGDTDRLMVCLISDVNLYVRQTVCQYSVLNH